MLSIYITDNNRSLLATESKTPLELTSFWEDHFSDDLSPAEFVERYCINVITLVLNDLDKPDNFGYDDWASAQEFFLRLLPRLIDGHRFYYEIICRLELWPESHHIPLEFFHSLNGSGKIIETQFSPDDPYTKRYLYSSDIQTFCRMFERLFDGSINWIVLYVVSKENDGNFINWFTSTHQRSLKQMVKLTLLSCENIYNRPGFRILTDKLEAGDVIQSIEAIREGIPLIINHSEELVK